MFKCLWQETITGRSGPVLRPVDQEEAVKRQGKNWPATPCSADPRGKIRLQVASLWMVRDILLIWGEPASCLWALPGRAGARGLGAGRSQSTEAAFSACTPGNRTLIGCRKRRSLLRRDWVHAPCCFFLLFSLLFSKVLPFILFLCIFLGVRNSHTTLGTLRGTKKSVCSPSALGGCEEHTFFLIVWFFVFKCFI